MPRYIDELQARASSSGSQSERDAIELQLKLHEAKREARFKVLGITLPLLAAALAVAANAAIAFYNSEASQEAASDAQSSSLQFQRLENQHDYDMIVLALMKEHHLLASTEPAKVAIEDQLCLYWTHAELGERVSRMLSDAVTLYGLCGSKGGGFPQLVVTGPQDSLRKQKLECIAAPKVRASATASDRSGFNSSPRARTTVTLTADADHFLGPIEIKADYRRQDGPSLSEQITGPSATVNYGGADLPSAYSGLLRCTNSRGTGRTCEASGTLTAISFPKECAQFFPNGFN